MDWCRRDYSRSGSAVSVLRYQLWLDGHGIWSEPHDDKWLHLTSEGIAVVVTITPPMSKNATQAALRRCTDDNLPVLIESFNVPHGELYGPANDGWPYIGLRTWARRDDGPYLELVEPVRPT